MLKSGIARWQVGARFGTRAWKPLSPRERTIDNSPAIHRWDWTEIEMKSVKRTAEKARHLAVATIQPSTSRTASLCPLPSSKLLGYYHSSALRTDQESFSAQPQLGHLKLRERHNKKGDFYEYYHNERWNADLLQRLGHGTAGCFQSRMTVDGRCLKTRCTSWPRMATAASPTTAAVMAVRVSPGTATTWTPMPTISRRSLRRLARSAAPIKEAN